MAGSNRCQLADPQHVEAVSGNARQVFEDHFICVNFVGPSWKRTTDVIIASKNDRRDAMKPFCHRDSICEHGMHGPHFLIGGQYRPVLRLHFPPTTYSPTIYGTTTGPTLRSPNQRGSSMSSVVAPELSKPLF